MIKSLTLNFRNGHSFEIPSEYIFKLGIWGLGKGFSSEVLSEAGNPEVNTFKKFSFEVPMDIDDPRTSTDMWLYTYFGEAPDVDGDYFGYTFDTCILENTLESITFGRDTYYAERKVSDDSGNHVRFERMDTMTKIYFGGKDE